MKMSNREFGIRNRDLFALMIKKKTAIGVRGMKLDANDELKEIYILGDGENETVEVKGKEIITCKCN